MKLHSADGQWPSKTAQDLLKVKKKKGMFSNGRVNHLTSFQLSCISLAEGKTEDETLQEQAGNEDSCSKGLADHHQVRNPASADMYKFQISGSQWLQKIYNQVLKMTI